jgi:CHAT domain-containing protein/tetratricopeptide (TPR) repeat protein
MAAADTPTGQAETAGPGLAAEPVGGTPVEYAGALEEARLAGDAEAVAAILFRLGEAAEGASAYQEALGRYESALRLLATGVSAEDQALAQTIETLRGNPKTFALGGRPPVSVDLYRAALAPLPPSLPRPEVRRRITFAAALAAGNLYLLQGQYPQAETLYGQALASQDPQTRAERRQVEANLAWSALRRRDLEAAEAWLATALGGVDPHDPPIELRRALLALGVQRRDQGRLQEALTTIERAVALYRAAADGRGQARALAHLGSAHLEAGQRPRAIECYRAALALAPEDPETAWHAHGGLARAYREGDDLAGAVQSYEAYLGVIERVGEGFRTDQGRVSFLESHDRLLEQYVLTAATLAEQTGDFTAARGVVERVRERALAALLGARPARAPMRAGAFPADRLAIQGWSAGNLQDPLSTGPATARTAPDVSRLTAQMAPAVPLAEPRPDEPFPAGGSTPSPARPRVEPPTVTLLEYFVLPDRTLVLVRSPAGRVAGAVAPLGSSQVDALVAAYRGRLGLEGTRGVVLVPTKPPAPPDEVARPGDEGDPEAALFRHLIAPVLARLPEEPGAPVVIVPHRALWLLPFAALRAPAGEYLGERHLLAYAPSETAWRTAAGSGRPARTDLRAWVVGNPRLPEQVEGCGAELRFAPLPWAEAEASAVAEIFGPDHAERFIGPEADALRLLAWHSGFGVVHLATHGVACPDDPLASFLALAPLEPGDLHLDPVTGTLSRSRDPRLPVTLTGLPRPVPDDPPALTYPGLLTAWTIASDFGLGADLVTLSACETGLGKALGQGNIGFTRAFLAAGARSLLVSLWRVDDRATRDLMVAFYREYLEHGNKALALQRAMRSVRASRPEPRYWAAFTLVGALE